MENLTKIPFFLAVAFFGIFAKATTFEDQVKHVESLQTRIKEIGQPRDKQSQATLAQLNQVLQSQYEDLSIETSNLRNRILADENGQSLNYCLSVKEYANRLNLIVSIDIPTTKTQSKHESIYELDRFVQIIDLSSNHDIEVCKQSVVHLVSKLKKSLYEEMATTKWLIDQKFYKSNQLADLLLRYETRFREFSLFFTTEEKLVFGDYGWSSEASSHENFGLAQRSAKATASLMAIKSAREKCRELGLAGCEVDEKKDCQLVTKETQLVCPTYSMNCNSPSFPSRHLPVANTVIQCKAHGIIIHSKRSL